MLCSYEVALYTFCFYSFYVWSIFLFPLMQQPLKGLPERAEARFLVRHTRAFTVESFSLQEKIGSSTVQSHTQKSGRRRSC